MHGQSAQLFRSLQPKVHPPTPRGTWRNFRETRGWVGKSGVLSRKAAISLKRVKIDETLLWMAYRNLTTLFRTVLSPTPYVLPFPKSGGVSRDCPKFLSTPIISGMGKATNFKFCTHSGIVWEQKTIKISAKVAVSVLRDSRKFSGHPHIGRIARSSSR